MKLAFSELKSDYARYTYPYVVWAFPEVGETPADFFERGFLPASPDLSRFYLCRNIRVRLGEFELSSENRRILRKGSGILSEVIPRAEFDYTEERRLSWKAYADQRFGEDIMGFARMDRLMSSPVISHLLVYREEATGKELGTALLHLEPDRVVYYYFAFYDLGAFNRSLGMFMMTSAVQHFANIGYHAIHLGTCYSEKALYKTQFAGVQFCNGAGWSDNLDELKFLIRREQAPVEKHLFDTPEYLEQFCGGSVAGLEKTASFNLGKPATKP